MESCGARCAHQEFRIYSRTGEVAVVYFQALLSVMLCWTSDRRSVRRLERYAEYVDSVAELEEAPGCEMCRSNRVMLENTWEVTPV